MATALNPRQTGDRYRGHRSLRSELVVRRMRDDGPYICDACGSETTARDAIRRATIADLDPETWQPLCCPDCGARLETVYVGETDG